MGGGAIGLTPIVGDVLLDPHLMDRLRILRQNEGISHIGFTTNGIAWHRRSERQRRLILETIDVLAFSVGGVDAGSYQAMYAVDRFEKVRLAIADVCCLKSEHELRLEIHVMFRVNTPIDELLADPGMAEFRRDEIDAISAMSSFGNWGGLITAEDLPSGAWLREVVTAARALRLSPDAVVLASDGFGRRLWEAAKPLREAGVHLVAVESRLA